MAIPNIVYRKLISEGKARLEIIFGPNRNRKAVLNQLEGLFHFVHACMQALTFLMKGGAGGGKIQLI